MKSILSIFLLALISCSSPQSNKLTIGFIDQLQDETLEKAKTGFFDALKQNGFDSSNVEIIYRNAQNDQPKMLQSLDYIISPEDTMPNTSS